MCKKLNIYTWGSNKFPAAQSHLMLFWPTSGFSSGQFAKIPLIYTSQCYEITQGEALVLHSDTKPSRWIQPTAKFSMELFCLSFTFWGKHFLEICIIFVVVTRAGVACRCVGGSRSGPWTTAAKFHRSTYSLHPILLAHTLNMQTHTLTAQTACIHGY